MENYKLKKYGQTLSSTFGAYFKTNFWKNFGFGALIVLAGILLGTPYFISVFNMENGSYSFTIPLILYLAFLVINTVFLPPFAIGYFGLKTKDFEEGKEPNSKHTRKEMFKNLGRLIGANAASVLCQFVIFVVLLALVALLLIAIFPIALSDVPIWFDSMEPLSPAELTDMFSFIGLAIVIIIVFYFISLCVFTLFMFTGFISLFEGEKGFKAVVKSIKLACAKNFWITLGQIVLSYIIYMTAFVIISVPFYILIFVTIFASMPSGSLVGFIVVYAVYILVILVFMIMAMGVCYNFATVLYFNAKARVSAYEQEDTDRLPDDTEKLEQV